MDTPTFRMFCLSVATLAFPGYLLHVHLDDVGQVSAWFVVTEECSFQSPLIQKVHRVSLEHSLLVRHTDQHGNAPALNLQIRAPLLWFHLKQMIKELQNHKSCERWIHTSWTHSKADIMALMLPVHSTLRSTPPFVISMSTWITNEKWTSEIWVLMNKGQQYTETKETDLLHWLVMVLGVHKISAPKFLSWKMGQDGVCNQEHIPICHFQLNVKTVDTLFIFRRVHVNTDDPWCPRQSGTFHGLIMWKHTEIRQHFNHIPLSQQRAKKKNP